MADEALAALDVTTQAAVLDLLDRLRLRHGLAILFISHDLRTVRRISDRIAVMSAGRIVDCAPPETDTGLLTVTPDSVGFAEARHWPTLDGRVGGSLRDEVEHFLAATHDGSPYRVPVAAALSAVLVNDAILEALRTGGPVRVAGAE